MENSPAEIQQQMADNIQWIKGAQDNKLVVGSQARILYADAEGRMKIAKAFNDAIEAGKIGPVVTNHIGGSYLRIIWFQAHKSDRSAI